MNNWENANDVLFAETDDPRLVLIIERDTEAEGPYGDALAPAHWINYRGGWRDGGRAGSTFDDDDAFDVAINAFDQFGTREIAERYLRIFHGIHVRTISSQGENLMILSTPAYRTHVGIEDASGARALNGAGEPISDEIAYSLDGEASEFGAWLEGNVFGIGWGVNFNRVSNDDPINLDDFDIEIQCWGFYGLEHAQEAASDGSYGLPTLPPFLDGTEIPAEVTE